MESVNSEHEPSPSEVGLGLDVEDDERTPIREELAKMSFEELQQLKERLGSRVYNEAMYGTSSRNRSRKSDFKRVNKNRPREMSSKIRVPALPNQNLTTNKKIPRDPRFDSLCGEYNEAAFKNSYSFLNDVRSKEKEVLKKEIETEEDEDRKNKMKYLVQRMDNQDREESNRKRKVERAKEEHSAQVEALRQGQKPQYRNKSEKRVIDLVDQFEDLKKSGKLQKHIEKQRKINATKERKKLELVG